MRQCRVASGPAGRLGAGRVAVVAVLAVLAGCTAAAPLDPPPPSSAPDSLRGALIEDVTADDAMVHVEALQRIADENGGHRGSPGPGYAASVDYVVGVLRSTGFEVSTPTFLLEPDDDDGHGHDEAAVIRNVVAQTRTGNTDQVVLVGAHLDSVREGPGINDNASGVAALLEIAERLGSSPEVGKAVRFGFWGAEEVNLGGSQAYVDSLFGRERESVAAYVNVDMVASPNSGYFVQGGAGDDEEETGPPGSAIIGQVLVEELQAAGIQPELVEFDDSSDYAAFVGAGVPSGGVFTGDEATMTVEQAERWDGEAGVVFDRCYHAACDRRDGLDLTALDRYTDAVAGTVARFASTQQPGR
jgi:aminopeptidase S